MNDTLKKIKRKLWSKLISYTRDKSYYFLIYRSYWRSLFAKDKDAEDEVVQYLAAIPNPGAGIGHQIANWVAGYWFTKQFKLEFAHIPFSTSKWESFLGFGEKEFQLTDLYEKGYSKIRIPLFDEDKPEELDKIKRIINAYSGEKVAFVCGENQWYRNQYGVMEEIQEKFYNAPARKGNDIQYDEDKFNIAVHVRRTVIIEDKVIEEDDEAKAKRWLNNDYYEKVLRQVLENIKVNKPIKIWLFSTGKPEAFAEFERYGDVRFCSDMDEYQSFAHLVFADLLITSKSSFSYKPALMNRGIKLCPRNFWHGYPNSKDWILCENDGTFDISKLKNI